MSETKFTPGPWAKSVLLNPGRCITLAAHVDRPFGGCANVDEQKAKYQLVVGWAASNKLVAMTDVEREANADLISTSPDLYEACRFALEIIQDQADRFHQECRCQLCESAPMILNAAMKKARGEK